MYEVWSSHIKWVRAVEIIPGGGRQMVFIPVRNVAMAWKCFEPSQNHLRVINLYLGEPISPRRKNFTWMKCRYLYVDHDIQVTTNWDPDRDHILLLPRITTLLLIISYIPNPPWLICEAVSVKACPLSANLLRKCISRARGGPTKPIKLNLIMQRDTGGLKTLRMWGLRLGRCPPDLGTFSQIVQWTSGDWKTSSCFISVFFSAITLILSSIFQFAVADDHM